jgi:lipid-A-disaccharide synthase
MGIFEILPKLPSLIKRKNEIIDDIISVQPNILITIDSPDFTLRIAKKIKRMTNIKTIHYVAPTVWAWRKNRAKRMAKYIDYVLALFPFEPKILQESGLKSYFVGHPIVNYKIATSSEVNSFKDKYGLKEKKILLVLPGSRYSEVKRLTGTFEKSLKPVIKRFPNYELIIPTTKNVEPYVRGVTLNWAKQPIIISSSNESEKKAAFYSANVALAASGTVSLELALNEVPMVIAYDINFFSRMLMNYLVKIDSVSLVNIVTGSKIIPEFIGKRCRPEFISKALLELMSDKKVRDVQANVQSRCISLLRPNGSRLERYFSALKVFEILDKEI